MNGRPAYHLIAAGAALALWEYAEASARRLFGDRLGGRVAEAVLTALRERGPLALGRLHAAFGRHRSGAELGAALDRLEGSGRARLCSLLSRSPRVGDR